MKWKRLKNQLIWLYLILKPYVGGFIACLVVLEPFTATNLANGLILVMAIDSIVASSIMETSSTQLQNLQDQLSRLSEKESEREISHVRELGSVKQDLATLNSKVDNIEKVLNFQAPIISDLQKFMYNSSNDKVWIKMLFGVAGAALGLIIKELFVYLAK